MRALITGGSGFIGSHLAEKLIDEGWRVSIIDDLSTGSLDNIKTLLSHPNFHFAIDTILNEMVLDRLVSNCDVIYHLAAAVGVELVVNYPVHTLKTNVEGTAIVFTTACRYRKPVVVTSSSEVYGKSTVFPFREDADTISGPTKNFRWAYACSKTMDEFNALAMAKDYDLPVYIIRLFNTTGIRQSGQYGMVLPRFIEQALNNRPITIYGDGKQSRCFANVKDIVHALVKLLDCPQAKGEVINLGSKEEISIAALAHKVKTLLKSESRIDYISYDHAYEIGFEDMQRRVPCLEKAKRILGYCPSISLDQSILAIADFMRSK